VKYEEVFKTFAEAIKPEDIEEEDSSLSVLNTKLLEEKENLLEEISKLKSNLRKAEANANKQKDLSIPEYRDLDNKYYQTTLDTINKFEEKVEILNEEKEKLGQEKTDLRKRVKELEDYIRNVSNKIIVEPAEPKETKKDPKNKKQANQIPIEESEEEEELPKTKKRVTKNDSEEKPPMIIAKKEVKLAIPDSLGIKKMIKNNSNPGPNPLSTFAICGICSMIIGKKESTPCVKCPATLHMKCLQERKDENGNKSLCTVCFEKCKSAMTGNESESS